MCKALACAVLGSKKAKVVMSKRATQSMARTDAMKNFPAASSIWRPPVARNDRRDPGNCRCERGSRRADRRCRRFRQAMTQGQRKRVADARRRRLVSNRVPAVASWAEAGLAGLIVSAKSPIRDAKSTACGTLPAAPRNLDLPGLGQLDRFGFCRTTCPGIGHEATSRPTFPLQPAGRPIQTPWLPTTSSESPPRFSLSNT